MTFETLLNLLHSLLGNANAVCIRCVEQRHDGVHGFPGHGASPVQDRVDGLQSCPIPVCFEAPPAACDGGVFARVWRIRDAEDLQSIVVSTLHHPLHALRPPPGVLRTMVPIDHQLAQRLRRILAQIPPLLEAIHEQGTRVSRGADDDGQQAAEPLQDTTGHQLFLRPPGMVPGLDGLAAARFPTAGQRSHRQCGLGIHGNTPGICACVRGLMLSVDRVEHRRSGAHTFDRLGLVHASHTVSQPVEDMPERVCARHVTVLPALRVDQRLTHGLRRHPCGAQRGWKRGISLAVGFRQGPPIFGQLWPLLCGWAIAAGGSMVHTGEAGPQCVPSQEHRPMGPATHGFCSPSTPIEGSPKRRGLATPFSWPLSVSGPRP